MKVKLNKIIKYLTISNLNSRSLPLVVCFSDSVVTTISPKAVGSPMGGQYSSHLACDKDDIITLLT